MAVYRWDRLSTAFTSMEIKDIVVNLMRSGSKLIEKSAISNEYGSLKCASPSPVKSFP